MNRNRTLLTAFFFTLMPYAGASAQSDYTFIAPSIVVPEGGTHLAIIRFDNQGEDVRTCHIDLCHDAAILEPVAVTLGYSLLELSSGFGPAFVLIDILPEAISLRFATSYYSSGWALTSGFEYEVAEVEYFGLGSPGSSTALEFCSLGVSIAPAVRIGSGLSAVWVTPDLVSGQVEIVEPFGGVFHLSPAITEPHPGLPFVVTVELDNPGAVESFEFGIRHDEMVLSVVEVREGAAILAVAGGAGPESFLVDLSPDGGSGFTVSCVVSFDPTQALPVGEDQPVVEVIYLAPALDELTCTVTRLQFTEDLGDPLVPISVTGAGTPRLAIGRSRTLRFGIPIPEFPTGGHTLAVGSAEGIPGGVLSVPVHLDSEDPIAGFSFGVSHDEALATAIEIHEGATLLPLYCGHGADFFGAQLVTGGVTVACVIDAGLYVSGVPLPAGSGIELARIDYLLDGAGSQSTLEIVGTLGTPPVAVELSSLDGIAIPPFTVPGSLVARPVFRRGDCNGDLMRDVGDAVFSLGALLLMGDTPDCTDACDVNDDGLFDIADPIALLNFLFMLGSPALPEPLGCGEDLTVDGLDCESFVFCY